MRVLGTAPLLKRDSNTFFFPVKFVDYPIQFEKPLWLLQILCADHKFLTSETNPSVDNRLYGTSQKRFKYVSDSFWKVFNLMTCLENVLKRSLQNVLKTSWRHLQNVLRTSWRCLEDVFARHLEDVLKTSWKRMTKTIMLVLIKTSWRLLEDVFWRRRRKTSSSSLEGVFINTNVCWDSTSNVILCLLLTLLIISSSVGMLCLKSTDTKSTFGLCWFGSLSLLCVCSLLSSFPNFHHF